MPWLLLGVALILGMAIGVLGMRQRYKAQEVVASVNGAPITKAALFERLQQANGRQMIRAMVGERLTLQYAEKHKVLPTDEEVTARFNAELKKEPKLREILAQRGVSEQQFRDSLKIAMAQANVLGKGVSVTEAEARRFYEQNIAKSNPNAMFYTPESVQIAVIVTRTEANARKALQDLNKGIPWQTVAKTYSADSSRQSAGVLPPTLRGRTRASKIPGLEKTIFDMKIGQRIGPKQFAGAWWIIRCLDKKPESTKPYDLVKNECKTDVGVLKAGKVRVKQTQASFLEFQKNAKIQAFWPQYRDAVKVAE